MSLNSFEYSNLKHTSIFTWIKELLDGKKAIDVLFVKRNLIRQENWPSTKFKSFVKHSSHLIIQDPIVDF